MKPALVALLLVPLVLPSAGASQAPEPTYPEEVRSLLPGWIQDAEALGAPHVARPWYPEADAFLQRAKAAERLGHVREAMFHIETYTELVVTGKIIDDAASLPSDAERKTFALERANAWNRDARAAWESYRARLKREEPDIRSLQAMELAMYSANEALGAIGHLDGHELLIRDLPRQPGFPRDHVLELARIDHTSLLKFGWAEDLLTVAGAREGLPPRIVAANWTLMVEAALADPGYDKVPSHLETLEELAGPVRTGNETVMAMVIALAEQRASRANSIFLIYGDAQSRGLDVLPGAARGMANQSATISLERPRSFGLLGVFTADALDTARLTKKYADEGNGQLGSIISAWSGLDHQEYVTLTLAAASPVQPPPPDPKKTPGATLGLVAIAATALALARRSAR